MEDSLLLSLPNPAWTVVFNNLDVRSLLNLACACRQSRQQTSDDVIVWKPLCARYGVTSSENYHADSFRQLYLKLLHRYGPLIGLWKEVVSPIGSMLVVHPDETSGCIKGSAVVAKTLNGRSYLRDVFHLELNPDGVLENNCWLGGAYEHGDENLPHDGMVDLELEQEGFEVNAFIATCSEECVFENCEINSRIPILLPGHMPPLYHIPQSLAEQFIPESQRGGLEQHWPDVRSLHPHEVMLQMMHSVETLETWPGREGPGTAAHFARLRVPHGGHELEGLWRGGYGSHGVELLCVEYDGEQPTCLTGTKITGDINIPAGKIAFHIFLDEPIRVSPQGVRFALDPDFYSRVQLEGADTEPLMEYTRYKGEGQVAQRHYKEPSFQEVEVVQFGAHCFGLLWEEMGTFTIFTRLHL